MLQKQPYVINRRLIGFLQALRDNSVETFGLKKQVTFHFSQTTFSYVATLFRLIIRFARVEILNSSPGDFRELSGSEKS